MPKLELSHDQLLTIQAVLKNVREPPIEAIDHALGCSCPLGGCQHLHETHHWLDEYTWRCLACEQRLWIADKAARCLRVQHGSRVQCELDNLHKGACVFLPCKECGRPRPEGSVPAIPMDPLSVLIRAAAYCTNNPTEHDKLELAALDYASSRGYVREFTAEEHAAITALVENAPKASAALRAALKRKR